MTTFKSQETNEITISAKADYEAKGQKTDPHFHPHNKPTGQQPGQQTNVGTNQGDARKPFDPKAGWNKQNQNR